MKDKKKYTVQDLYDEVDRQQMEMSSAGYDKIGLSILVVFVILIVVFISVILFKIS